MALTVCFAPPSTRARPFLLSCGEIPEAEMETTRAFTALKRFDSRGGESWSRYLEFSQLGHLREVISLDAALCPCALAEYSDEDWEHVASGIDQFGFFADFHWASQRFPSTDDTHLLLVEKEPSREVSSADVGADFTFIGYDLIDDTTWISALTNCGGFDLAFSGDELTVQGLLPRFDRARAVQDALRQHYPEEPHADTSLYAVWRRETSASKEHRAKGS